MPKISPYKTWAGLIGAFVFSATIGVVFYKYLNFGSGCAFIYSTVILGMSSQIGDLFESWIKRKAGVKDSGKKIPGHGGILDRVDGLVVCSVVLVIILAFFKKNLF